MSSSMTSSSVVRSTAEDLRKQGYSVVVQPDPSAIPFDLQQYRPDILATRGDENLIIDIKTKDSHRSVERYKEIAEIVGSHENWRFMLSTVGEADSTAYPTVEGHIDAQVLNRMLRKIDTLLSGENYDLALPYLWSMYISAMRTIGERADVPMDVTSDRSVLNYMYSLGEISGDEYEWAQKFLALRNKTVHSLEVDISRETMLEMHCHTKQKLREWALV